MRLVIDLQGAQTPQSALRGVGRYTMGLTEAMLREAGSHEIVLALNAAWPKNLKEVRRAFATLLPPERIRAWRTPIPVASDSNVTRWRVRAAEALRENFLARLGGDVAHVFSVQEGFDDDAITSIGGLGADLPTGCTVYDVTPAARADEMLIGANHHDWYQDKLRHYHRAQRWLAISKATRRDAIEFLGLPPDAVVVVPPAAAAHFQPRATAEDERTAIGRRFGIGKPFILYFGGFEPHKNLERLLAAFASLPAPQREQHHLVLAGAITPARRAQLTAVGTEHGVTPAEYTFLGYVTDEALLALLHGCTACIYPSLREGFGLPVVEAMAAGAAVICGDTSSLPEVIGRQDAMFDPTNAGSIADRLSAVLTDPAFRATLRGYGPERASFFSWRSSAKSALAAYEELHEETAARQREARPVTIRARRPPTLAWLADWPLPPGRIDDLVKLAQHYEIDVLLSDGLASRQVLIAGLPVLDLARNAPRLSTYDRVAIEREDAAQWLEMCPSVLVQSASSGGRETGPAPLAVAQLDTTADGDRPALIAETIERGYVASASPVALARALARCMPRDVDPAYEQQLVAAMAANLAPTGSPRLLVDVSGQIRRRAVGGIARVTQQILRQLLLHPPHGLVVEAVGASPPGGPFFHARQLASELLGQALPDNLPSEPVELRPGDHFLGLDLHHLLYNENDFFARLRELGGQAHIVIYDLLPMQRADWFPPAIGSGHQHWFEAIAELDGVMCISRAVAADVTEELERLGRHDGWPRVGWFHLGADLPAPAQGGPVRELVGRPTILLVSTLFARKGHGQALAAFEELWATGVDVNFVLVGEVGWGVDDVIDRLRNHTERGRRLFWYADADDALLARLYATASGVLAPSEGEGFGLPLVEAALHGRPVLARDIPVFHEILGEGSRYFTGLDATSLAAALRVWLQEIAAGTAPLASTAELLEWSEATRRLVRAIGLQPDG